MIRGAVIAAALAGCLGPSTEECPGGGVCPGGLACRLDGADQICVLPDCGNGVIDPGETCDDGNNTSGDACPAACVGPRNCGNGAVDSGEDCDDGNTASDDGCEANCRFPVYPSPRAAFGMSYDPVAERMILFGGMGVGWLDDLWQFDGAAWTELAETTPRPSPRSGTRLVYDDARNNFVLFGGRVVGVVEADMWWWDRVTWTGHEPITTPPAREHHAMAYDTARGRVVLFGGQDMTGQSLDDTAEWDGTSWSDRSPAMRPPARYGYAMAYDSTRQRMVLFGGSGPDVWEWDGLDWAQKVRSPHPPERYGGALAFDAIRNRTVLFGGIRSTGSNPRLSDTWEWDGDAWTQRTGGPVPTAREGHAMAFDSARGVVVMFGGTAGSPTFEYLDDTWLWDGTEWRQEL